MFGTLLATGFRVRRSHQLYIPWRRMGIAAAMGIPFLGIHIGVIGTWGQPTTTQAITILILSALIFALAQYALARPWLRLSDPISEG